MDASRGMAGDGGLRVHFIRSDPQLIDGRGVCPSGAGKRDIRVFVFVRVRGLESREEDIVTDQP